MIGLMAQGVDRIADGVMIMLQGNASQMIHGTADRMLLLSA